MIEIAASVLLGVIAGTFTGIMPGIHINLVSAGVVFLSPFLVPAAGIGPVCCFIVAMAVTHTFTDIIPSIYLGAPEEETAMGMLPGHKLLLKGMGHEAVKMTVIGSLLCLIACAAIFPVLAFAFPLAYRLIENWVWLILLACAAATILSDKGLNQIFWGAVVFIFSGVMGILVFESSIRQPLLPMLSGLFGVSTLIYSAMSSAEIPPQNLDGKTSLKKSETAKAAIAGAASGSLVALLPGLSSSHAASFARLFLMKTGEEAYLITIGGISTVNFFSSIATMLSLGKARNGAVASILELAGGISASDAASFVFASLLAGGIAAIISLKISRIFAKAAPKLNYKMLCAGAIVITALLTAAFSGIAGIYVLATATAIGLVSVLAGSRRSNAMGCILVPVIISYLN